MKIMFISDIHGIKNHIDFIKKEFIEEGCDKLVVLGDLYYIGPKNQMIKDYDISYVEKFLESFKDKMICIQGNCDSEVDIEFSNFPIIYGLSRIQTDTKELFITHGHLYNENHWNRENSILIFGHYHIPFIKEIGNNLFINPGSISLPKDNHKPSYLIFDEKYFIIYDVDKTIIAQKKVSE